MYILASVLVGIYETFLEKLPKNQSNDKFQVCGSKFISLKKTLFNIFIYKFALFGTCNCKKMAGWHRFSEILKDDFCRKQLKLEYLAPTIKRRLFKVNNHDFPPLGVHVKQSILREEGCLDIDKNRYL